MPERRAAWLLLPGSRQRGRAAMAVGLAVGLLAAACGDEKGEDRPDVDVIGGGEGSASVSGPAEGYGDPLYFPSTDQSTNLAIGADLRDLKAIMAAAARGDAVDWQAATALYENGKHQREADGSIRSLASLARRAAGSGLPGAEAGFTDRIIRAGLSGTGRGAGLGDNARRQLVDKGVQVLMYTLAIDRMGFAEAKFAANETNVVATIDEAWAILSGERDPTTQSPNDGLLATGLAREEDFKLAGRLSRPLESSLLAAAAAAERDDAEAFARSMTASRGYLNTIMYLSVLRYAKVLEVDQRASDREFHLAEGWAYFQALRPVVGAATIGGMNAVENAYSRPSGEDFPRSLAQDVYGAMNHPAMLRALAIPEEFQFPTVPE